MEGLQLIESTYVAQPFKTQLAQKVARAILAGFESMFADFLSITLAAHSRFEKCQWQDVHSAMRKRLYIYEGKVEQVCEVLTTVAYDELDDHDMWYLAKAHYAELVEHHDNAKIAQTFFNSVFGTLRGHHKLRNVHVFIHKKRFSTTQVDVEPELSRIFSDKGLLDAFGQLLDHFKFRVPYQDRQKDLSQLERIINKVAPNILDITQCEVEFFHSLFFRNKGAYVIGQLIDKKTSANLPFAVALLNEKDKGIFIDAIVLGQEQLGMLCDLTRAYFMVDTDQPVKCVEYLSRLMPQKKVFELFNAIGFIKHAKTEFYRYKVEYTKELPEQVKYQEAPGIKGMVMLVFTADDTDYVYKVIRDRFPAPKDTTRQKVKDKYEFVKQADRVGRLVDTQEFNYLAFDLKRFSKDLLETMEQEIGDAMFISGPALVLKHVYVERRMTPLNLYLKNASEQQVNQIMDEYGITLKQLAAANIFPGDLLLKNFGVTQSNKVVFYDYDELCSLTDCQFREIPQVQDEMDELNELGWFDVEENDVFPQQFATFYGGHPQAKKALLSLHPELFTPEFWNRTKASIQHGHIADVYPYPEKWRF